MAAGVPGVPLAGLRGGGGHSAVRSGLIGGEILSVRIYHDEMEE
jgi:hypothetical protein